MTTDQSDASIRKEFTRNVIGLKNTVTTMDVTIISGKRADITMLITTIAVTSTDYIISIG